MAELGCIAFKADRANGKFGGYRILIILETESLTTDFADIQLVDGVSWKMCILLFKGNQVIREELKKELSPKSEFLENSFIRF